jgi:anaerobic magnesium-protoporphyrin IX monomethyl ester cyclase
VVFTRDEFVEGDVAIVLSSLVDYRHEAAWADGMRARGVRVGFVGLAASKLPQLFADHADFIITGEPEEAFGRLVRGEQLHGICPSVEIDDLDALPFPRWDLLVTSKKTRTFAIPGVVRPMHGGFPLLASRSCPESCTYCPHRILSTYRARSIGNVVDEIEQIAERYPRPYIVFRDPLFSQDRERSLALCDEILSRGLNIKFECETRLDRLDESLIDAMHKAGLRAMTFGVETESPETLRKVARRPIPPRQQVAMVEHSRRRGIVTGAFYVLGFLQDDWASISATIGYAVELGTTVAQFKLLTPYPATPLWKQMQPLVREQDWQKFDGFTPTFKHPTLTDSELRFLLGAAFVRFYLRPSWLANYLGVRRHRVLNYVRLLDERVSARQARQEVALMSRALDC